MERLWQEKLNMYREEREKELEIRRKKAEDDSFKQEIIRQEKRRLLELFASELDGFQPKGLVNNQ